MKKSKRKIYRKYEDFYSAKELRDPDNFPPINLTINDFDASGAIVNPRAPCLATTIDPNYVKDARTQHLSRKFRMKSDILLLREITRKNFMIHYTQQMYADKEAQKQLKDEEYKKILEFYDFTEKSLKIIEANAFKDMQASLEKWQELRKNTLADELKAVVEDHRRALVEAHDIYQRFLYLLKLISYFDDVDEEGIGGEGGRLQLPTEITALKPHNESDAGVKQIEIVKQFMHAVVQPYLAKRNHTNPAIWLKGYELTRTKISNYYKRYTNLALLNHIVAVLYEKFQKTQARCKMPPMLKDADFIKKRLAALKLRTDQTLLKHESKQKQDKLSMKLNAITPVMLSSLKNSISQAAQESVEQQKNADDDKKLERNECESIRSLRTHSESALSSCREEPDTTMAKIEQIQQHLLWLLNELDDMPPELCRDVEKRVRRRVQLAKEKSRRALVEQTRLEIWMTHFTKHELQRQKDTAICLRRKTAYHVQ